MSADTTDTEQILRSAHQWWNGLETQWQMAFNMGVLRSGVPLEVPKDDHLIFLYRDAVNIRLAGPNAPFPNIGFELTNLSGVGQLLQLTFLSVTEMALTNLNDLSGLKNLRNLFVQNNRITSLEGIEGNTQLTDLYAQGNLITSLEPIRHLKHLQTISVSGNQLASLDGITPDHADEMRQCFVLPNENLRDRDVLKLQNECGIIARKG